MTTDRQFEWDVNKAAKNLDKHRVDFAEAATVFDDPVFITVVDDEHSADEERYITLGLSAQGQLLVVAHTDRASRIRIISARRATRKEELFYAEQNKRDDYELQDEYDLSKMSIVAKGRYAPERRVGSKRGAVGPRCGPGVSVR